MNLKTIYNNINLKLLEINDQKFIDKLLLIRNEDNVRNFMFDNQMIDKDSHIRMHSQRSLLAQSENQKMLLDHLGLY